MQQTATERFGGTDYNSEHVERPGFLQENYHEESRHEDRSQHPQQEEGSYVENQAD